MTLHEELKMILDFYESQIVVTANRLLNQLKESYKTYGEIIEEIKKVENEFARTYPDYKRGNETRKCIIKDIINELRNIVIEELHGLQPITANAEDATNEQNTAEVKDFRTGISIQEMCEIHMTEESEKRRKELAELLLEKCRSGHYSAYEIKRALRDLEESLQNIPLK